LCVPTYDYQCRSCGVITELVHSMLEDGPTECELCGGQLRPVVHPTGIIFRGSGFYKTDSRSSSSRSVAGESRSPSEPSSGDASSLSTTAKETGSTKGKADAPSGGAAGKSSGESD
jgi:putative FmdB family regulatory protein